MSTKETVPANRGEDAQREGAIPASDNAGVAEEADVEEGNLDAAAGRDLREYPGDALMDEFIGGAPEVATRDSRETIMEGDGPR
jgi:hypothetical protein